VTAQPSAYARLRRALDRDNATDALAAAAELPTAGLVEARQLCLLLCADRPEQFGRAALRWHGRYCREVRDVDVDERQAVLAALGALRSRRKAAAARAMTECSIAVLSNVLTKFLSTGQGSRRRRESALCASPSTTASARRAGCSGKLWRGCSVASKQRRALMTTT
jgi:hypothetical protein